MLNTFGEIKNDVIVKSGIATSSAFITDDILNNWINMAYTWAASYKKWAFTEKRDKTTSYSIEENNYPSDFKTDSIRIMTIGGERLQKLNFEDYLIFKEKNSSSSDRVFSDFNRVYYINPNIDLSGTIAVYGQYLVPKLDVTEPDSETVFSNAEEEGNEAIVEKVLAFVKKREEEEQNAIIHDQKAVAILDGVWKKQQDEQFAYHSKNRGMYEYIDVIDGQPSSELIKRNQF